MPLHLLPGQIVQRAVLLPAFPLVVKDILHTLDDESAALSTLSDLVAKDPVITARIFSMANAAASAGSGRREIRDIQVALSLIGMARLREIALTVSIAEVFAGLPHGSQFLASQCGGGGGDAGIGAPRAIFC